MKCIRGTNRQFGMKIDHKTNLWNVNSVLSANFPSILHTYVHQLMTSPLQLVHWMSPKFDGKPIAIEYFVGFHKYPRILQLHRKLVEPIIVTTNHLFVMIPNITRIQLRKLCYYHYYNLMENLRNCSEFPIRQLIFGFRETTSFDKYWIHLEKMTVSRAFFTE